jgi:glycosyltransferase involved in cell wall biosynthesis
MFILITSCEKNQSFRDALRETWLKDVPNYLFIVGGAEKTHIQDDILYVKAKDNYASIPEKQLQALQYCSSHIQFEHIFMCDDDAYVVVDRLLDSDYNLYDYYGGGPIRQWDIPYYATGGPGICLSKKAVNVIVDTGKNHLKTEVYISAAETNLCNTEDCFWGDRFIGVTLKASGIEPFYESKIVERCLNPYSPLPDPKNDIISYHCGRTEPRLAWLTIEKIKKTYDEFQKPQKPIRVALIINQWSMGGAEKEFADMMLDADPTKIQYVGVAIDNCYKFCVNKKYKHKLPPFHSGPWFYEDAIDKDLIKHSSYEQAINAVASEADVILKWHIANEYLEGIKKPTILICNATSWYTESTNNMCVADKYVANSAWSSKWFPKNAPQDKIEVIYSGHEEATVAPVEGREKFREQLGFAPTDKIVSHIGRINLDKNIPTLVESVGALGEDWKLMLVGHVVSFQEQRLKKMLDKHLPGRYKIVPWVDHVGDAFAASDVFVLTSYYEGFSNSLAEAWMSKTPSVFSRCGSANELMEKYGNIGIDVGTNVPVVELAASIEKAIENVEGTQNAYNMIKAFDKQKSARKWERCIKEVCYREKPIKVGFLMPNLSFGGQEVLVETLARGASKGCIQYTFFKPRGFGVPSEIDTIVKLSEFMDIYIEETEPHIAEKIREIGLNNVYFHNVENLMVHAEKMDAIVTWGLDNLEELVGNLKSPVILLSQCSDQWNKEVIKNTCHVATDFVATSEAANIFPDCMKKAVKYMGNPIAPKVENVTKTKDEVRKEWGANEDDVLIGFVGRWDYQKNPLALANGISGLPDNYKAVYIGTDWRYETLSDCEEDYYRGPTYEKELNYRLSSGKYILVPYQKNIANCYNALDAVMVPSRNEGFGLQIVEAWTMKKPLICTEVGIYKSFIEDGLSYGTTINHDDPVQELAHAIKHSLTMSDEELERIKNRAFNEFNMVGVSNKWYSYLKNAVENSENKNAGIDYKGIIQTLMPKYRTAKRIARRLNIIKFPHPEGHNGWDYTMVSEFLDG